MAEEASMNTRQKILLGGLGALTPVVLNLLVVDLRTLQVDFSPLVAVGYVLRVVVLFYLGGLIAFLHKEETHPTKLFELGIAAPALITALLNAGNVAIPRHDASAAAPVHALSILAAPVYAQSAEEPMKSFSLPVESAAKQVLRGLTGSTPDATWFVITGSYRKVENAQKHATKINQMSGPFKADVYLPYGGNPYYAVVIGANLNLDDARRLRQEAIEAGLAKDTYLWTFPK
jgi:hypothetical protein